MINRRGMEKKMDRWDVYEALKGNRQISEQELEMMNHQELIEGILEYIKALQYLEGTL